MTTTPTAATPDQPLLFQAFAGQAGGYNELFELSGTPRPHWQTLIDAFNSAGSERLQQRQQKAARMRHEDGATFNPFADQGGRISAWPLDLLPLAITSDEWREIETGVIQRARLLEAILEDVYGSQQLLAKGQIPAELIYANPAFLRPCHAIMPAGGRHLCLYAVDLFRGDNGRFTVLRDYGDNPAGLGYALENRIVISRIFSELYHTTQIRRLAPFFHRLHRSILERNALGQQDPGVVVLSPGPECQTYFEHAFLSRYLGYPLVEGQDLTVRNGQVYLKKLAGLEPVEAIFRQIADRACDPFALQRQSIDGVAGLVQAAREGTVDLINPLGSGFVDTPLLAALLPGLCQQLRNEELLLASRPLWWGGDDRQRQHLLEGLNHLQFTPALDRNAPRPSADQLASILASHPYQVIAGEPIRPGLAPVFDCGQATLRPNLLRVFACASADGFTVMPGGLAIIADEVIHLTDGSPQQQQTKDVWVLSEQPVEPFSLLATLQSTTEFSRSSDLPSRVADNLLWLGRYLERAEGRIRLLRAILRRISGETRLQDIDELPFLLQLLDTPAGESTADSEGPVRFRQLMAQLRDRISNPDNLDSVMTILWKVQETARNVRDRLSLDCWRVINHLEAFLESPTEDPLELLEDTLYNLSAFSGLAMESMTRGLGWRFMDMGRRLERALFQTAMLQRGLPEICNRPRTSLEALLEAGDSIMTYRARYRTTYQLAPVLDLLIVDESNPKSLAFQFSQLASHVDYLPRQEERRYSTPEERITLELLTATRLLDLQQVHCGNDSHSQLADYLGATEQRLLDFAQRITAHYLSRVSATPHFSGRQSERNG